MGDYFSKFMQQTRINVPVEVASRWRYDARSHGDINIKAQMATARRTATLLEKSGGKFSNLRPEQELAIKAAASAMRTLANDLQGLATWAKAFKSFCDAEYKKDRVAELEAIASQRWGNDDEALAFEGSLIRELTTTISGRLALGKWMHAQGRCTHVAADSFSSPFTSGRFRSPGHVVRVEAAEYVEDAMKSRERYTSFDKKYICCSWSDYEAYLAYRKAVASTTARVIQMVSQP